MADPIDTNVVLRYLVEDPESIAPEFKGVFDFFATLDTGERTALLTPLVVFQSYFVLTSYYEVPRPQAASKLRSLLSFRGLRVPERAILRGCLGTLTERSVDLVDAYLASLCATRQLNGVYSYDEGLRALGVVLLPVD
jgi:predicted nucleic acid-binding protein